VRPSQPACIDAAFRHDHLAGLTPFLTPMDHQVPLPSDDAPASAAEVPTTRDAPHRKVVNASDWAASATRPDITPSDANGSTAEDSCATSAHAFPYDGGTGTITPKPSTRQESEDVNPSPVIRSDRVAATHGDEKASQHHSPDAGDVGGLKNPTTTALPITAAVAAPARDHHHRHHPHQVLGDDPGAAPDEAPASRERDCPSSLGRQGVDVVTPRTLLPAPNQKPSKFSLLDRATTHIGTQHHRTHQVMQETSICPVHYPTDGTVADVPTSPPASRQGVALRHIPSDCARSEGECRGSGSRPRVTRTMPHKLTSTARTPR
jgi:hypothetical protein